jgi:hypothetical protein
VKNRFQAFAFKCNLYHYAAEKAMAAAGAQPALMSRTAAFLRRWEATPEWSSA